MCCFTQSILNIHNFTIWHGPLMNMHDKDNCPFMNKQHWQQSKKPVTPEMMPNTSNKYTNCPSDFFFNEFSLSVTSSEIKYIYIYQQTNLAECNANLPSALQLTMPWHWFPENHNYKCFPSITMKRAISRKLLSGLWMCCCLVKMKEVCRIE